MFKATENKLLHLTNTHIIWTLFYKIKVFGFLPLPFLHAFLLPDLLASHFRTDWVSCLGLGYQVGSTTDHLTNYYLQDPS